MLLQFHEKKKLNVYVSEIRQIKFHVTISRKKSLVYLITVDPMPRIIDAQPSD